MCLTTLGLAAERLVLLAPAAGDILLRLEVEDQVVGVSSSVEDFPRAQRVGTHMNPSLERIASLHPTVIVSTSRLDTASLERLGGRLILYEPRTMDGIIHGIRQLAAIVGREAEGDVLAANCQTILDELISPPHRPSILYETRAEPLTLAGDTLIVQDMLRRAGFAYAEDAAAGLTSVEYLLRHPPEIYMYQEGPMNKNPLPPSERSGWGAFSACQVKVDELTFARPNVQLFEQMKALNTKLQQAGSLCP